MDKNHIREIGYDHIASTLGRASSRNIYHLDLPPGCDCIKKSEGVGLMFGDCVVICLCCGGSGEVLIDGRSYQLVAGAMVVTTPHNNYRLLSSSSDFAARAVVCRIPPHYLYETAASVLPRAQITPIVALGDGERQTLSSLMEYIRATTSNPNSAHGRELDACIMSLLHDELSEIYLRYNLDLRRDSSDEVLARKFNMLLSVNAVEHRDVDWYAQELGHSPKRLAEKIRKVTGHTPTELITSAVIHRAKRLLSATDLTTSEIAEELNFANASYFCRYFRRYAGKTPTEWRNMQAQP